mgnify:CR=1 FL=1
MNDVAELNCRNLCKKYDDKFVVNDVSINLQAKKVIGLLGPNGAGKTTLSRFVAWMNGLTVFQIKVHNKYSAEDFDEDLRQVLRRSGCKDEKICFILDESNVMDSGFLERMNTLLANGEVPGLFEGDEHTTLMTQCKEGAQRQGLMLDTNEELYKWFTHQVMKNLHVVFTMNPSENGLKDRAATSPALFNRCVLNWFGDWSDSAFFQVPTFNIVNTFQSLSLFKRWVVSSPSRWTWIHLPTRRLTTSQWPAPTSAGPPPTGTRW